MGKIANTKNGGTKASLKNTQQNSGGVVYEESQDPWDMTQSPIFADFNLEKKLVRGSMLHIDFLSAGQLTKMILEISSEKMLFVRKKEFLMPQGFFVVDYQDENCIEHIVQCTSRIGQSQKVYIFEDASPKFIKDLKVALPHSTEIGVLSINRSSGSPDNS